MDSLLDNVQPTFLNSGNISCRFIRNKKAHATNYRALHTNCSMGCRQTCRPTQKVWYVVNLLTICKHMFFFFFCFSNKDIIVLRHGAEIDRVVEGNCSQVKLSDNGML